MSTYRVSKTQKSLRAQGRAWNYPVKRNEAGRFYELAEMAGLESTGGAHTGAIVLGLLGVAAIGVAGYYASKKDMLPSLPGSGASRAKALPSGPTAVVTHPATGQVVVAPVVAHPATGQPVAVVQHPATGQAMPVPVAPPAPARVPTPAEASPQSFAGTGGASSQSDPVPSGAIDPSQLTGGGGGMETSQTSSEG